MQCRRLADGAEHLREAAGLTISTTLHPPGGALPRHTHERAYFCYVMRGRFDEISGSASHRCGAGTLVYHPSGDVHADRFAAATRCLNIELPQDWEDGAGRLIAACRQREQRSGPQLSMLAQRLHGELLRDDAASGLALHGLVLELAAEWSRFETSPGRAPLWLAEAVRIVRAEFRGNIELRQVAARVGVHPVQLSRTFHRVWRMTMTEFVSRLRVDFAAHLLEKSTLPLSTIALEAGFADQSHLSRVFRRYAGTTCGRYRASHGVKP
jgi:AraC family transcriptional regulator